VTISATALHHYRGLNFVSNGLTLCKIHHAAYDENILGISGDYVVHINEEVLREVDGPMLRYGLQAMDGRNLFTPPNPSERPDRERLDHRFQRFKSA
jgi:putative restriction endonuclease